MLKIILEEINKYKNNQIEFKEAITDFIEFDLITTITPKDNN